MLLRGLGEALVTDEFSEQALADDARSGLLAGPDGHGSDAEPGRRRPRRLTPPTSGSRGRRYAEPPPDWRSEFQRDRDRIIHAGAFRRLEYKTQVFVNHEGDLFRTRLTHSLEVSQVARTIARALGLNEDLTEAIALAHDLGHTPFGHAGQDALNRCMREYGGFEHNLQSLRVVDSLERRYADFDGLNLTFETREGILKRCARGTPQQLGELGTRFLEGGHPSLEAQLTNLADEIAYNSHDVDDGLRAGFIGIWTSCTEVPLVRGIPCATCASYHPGLATRRRTIYQVVRHLISHQVDDLHRPPAEATPRRPRPRPTSTPVRARRAPLVAFTRRPWRKAHRGLKHFLYHNLYCHYRVHRMNQQGAARHRRTVRRCCSTTPGLLPTQPRQRLRRREEPTASAGAARAVADYIAGMTDRYAIAEHERLFTTPPTASPSDSDTTARSIVRAARPSHGQDRHRRSSALISGSAADTIDLSGAIAILPAPFARIRLR
ncbi:MAG: deoxyguanosinetriphosphate triphosphohydrolase [Arhodomonas sp.]|nr:deoxyguanosinetriphosphate triphosphohydrolase [Arhodomonas sp.]